MLIAVAFALLAVIFGGDTPFVIPKLDNYVKTHIVDDGRKQIVLESLKDAKAKRKAKLKQTNKEIKKLDHLFNSRETTKEEMNKAIKVIIDLQAESQKANIKANQEAQQNITTDEWNAIMINIGEGLTKTNKKMNKANAQISKQYTKWENKIGKVIADKDKRAKAIEVAQRIKTIYIKNREIIQSEIMNKNSAMYQYKTSEEELNVLQIQFVDLMQEAFDAVVETHFELIDLTTEEEWKKIL